MSVAIAGTTGFSARFLHTLADRRSTDTEPSGADYEIAVRRCQVRNELNVRESFGVCHLLL